MINSFSGAFLETAAFAPLTPPSSEEYGTTR